MSACHSRHVCILSFPICLFALIFVPYCVFSHPLFFLTWLNSPSWPLLLRYHLKSVSNSLDSSYFLHVFCLLPVFNFFTSRPHTPPLSPFLVCLHTLTVTNPLCVSVCLPSVSRSERHLLPVCRRRTTFPDPHQLLCSASLGRYSRG